MSNVRSFQRAGAAPAPQASAGPAVEYVKSHRGLIALVVVAVVGLYLWNRFGNREEGAAAAAE